MIFKVVIFALLISSTTSAIVSCGKCEAFLQDVVDALGDQPKTATLDELDDAVKKACKKEFGVFMSLACKPGVKKYEDVLLQGIQEGQSPEQMCKEASFC